MIIDPRGKRIILAKTNQIGDVTFALPIASRLKQMAPDCHIIFLGRGYTRALIEQYRDVDEFADWKTMSQQGDVAAIAQLKQLKADVFVHINPRKDLAKLVQKAGIRFRVGTSRRFYHWLYCNVRPNVSRKDSSLHETQLDMKILQAFGDSGDYTLDDICALRHYKPWQGEIDCLSLLDSEKFNLILHPLTRGRHIEWSLDKFAELINILPKDKFKIFITGSAEEGEIFRSTLLTPFPDVVDLAGKISLNELLVFIASVDGLIAASTGPVHLAANFDINTLGLYAPIRPFDAGRWGPVGNKAEVLHLNKNNCDTCRLGPPCVCINSITVAQVAEVVTRWEQAKLPQATKV